MLATEALWDEPVVKLGPPAIGADYVFGDVAALAALETGIDKDLICAVIAPRRSGKSSLMHFAEARLRERRPEAQSAFVDLAPFRSPWEFLRQIAPEPRELLLMGQVQDADIQTALRSVLDARQQGGAHPFVLFLDEVDYAVRASDPEKWRELLKVLIRNGNTRLVLSMDSVFAQSVLDLLPPSAEQRLRIIKLTPWPADTIRNFLDANLNDSAARPFIPMLVKRLAPGWPFETILVMFELEEALHGAESDPLEFALARAAYRLGGGSINEILQHAPSRKSAHAAAYLLQMLAQADGGVQLDEATAQSGKRWRLHELDDAARQLVDLGLVSLDKEAKRIRPATGLIRQKLAQEFSA